MNWNIDYRSGLNGEGNHREWYEVSNGKRTFNCDASSDAHWLATLLNSIEFSMRTSGSEFPEHKKRIFSNAALHGLQNMQTIQ
jgi:hypothetical protein